MLNAYRQAVEYDRDKGGYRDWIHRNQAAGGGVGGNRLPAAGLESLPRTLREAITVAAQSEFISRELPTALQSKYFAYQSQLCHDFEAAPDPAAWENQNTFLIL